jgi:predicted amidophosphoribosyltransferase
MFGIFKEERCAVNHDTRTSGLHLVKKRTICLLCDEARRWRQPDLHGLRNRAALARRSLPDLRPAAARVRHDLRPMPAPTARLRTGCTLDYSFPVDSLITRFKHSAKWPFGHLLAELLGQFLQHRFEDDLPRPDAWCRCRWPPRRLRQRGFNQACDARALAGRNNSIYFPATNGCNELSDTSAQQDLNARRAKQPAQRLCSGCPAHSSSGPSPGAGGRRADHRRHSAGTGATVDGRRRRTGRRLLPGPHAQTRYLSKPLLP